jgi:IS30 family transposase
MVSYVDQQWQADLVEMQKYANKNIDYKYILTVIDVFSRFAFAHPLKSKRGMEVRNLFENIFEFAEPGKIQFDEGKEFYNGGI